MFSHNQLCKMSLAAALTCGGLISSSAIGGAPSLEVVAFQGLENSPPNFPGLYWNLAQTLNNPLIDSSGQTTFTGTIFGDGITPANNKVQWYGSESGWSNVLRNGDPAPGIPGVTLLSVSGSGSMSSNGTLMVTSTLVLGGPVTTANDTAFWVGTPGDLDLVARENTTVAPGPDGAVLSSPMTLTNFALNNAGQVLFGSSLAGGTPVVTAANNSGVYLGSSSGLVEVWRKGNPIPGAPALPAPDGPFMTPDLFTLRLNSAGEVLSLGTLVAGTAGGVTANDDAVLWTTVGGMRIVAREGAAVPGMTDVRFRVGSIFTLPGMAITNSGKIVFQATLENSGTGTSVTASNDTCYFVEDHGVLSVLVREGDPIDGETFNFAATGYPYVTDNLVAIAGASTAASNNGRLWTGPIGGPYTKIAQQAVTELPGEPGVLLSAIPSSAQVALNGVGQLVFSSNLTGAGVVVSQNDLAIFAWDQAQGLQMIARRGVTTVPNMLEISVIGLIGAVVTGDNGSPILTDNGWLVFRVADVKNFNAVVRTKPFPISCDADIAPKGGDGVVNTQDLLAVIGAWGACPDPKNCSADIAPVGGDDVVNTQDLLTVIGTWGACP